MTKIASWGATLLFASITVCASASDRTHPTNQGYSMNQSSINVANSYYAAFIGEHPLAELPMADNLTFVSPRFSLNSAASFRGALSELFKRVRSIKISDQFHDDETVLTFYQLDLGVPDGPIPMAERLRIQEGKITKVDLLFDSARLPAPPVDADAKATPDPQ